MIVTTTSGIQGKEIIEYIDIVNGEAIMGAKYCPRCIRFRS